MFNWIRRKIGNWLILDTNSILSDLDLYRDEDRLIFSFFDGKEMRRVDPMILYRRYLDISADLQADIAAFKAQVPNKFAPDAYQKALSRLRDMLELEPLGRKEGGLTETEVFNVYRDFMIFCEDIKKKANLTPTLPEATSHGSPSSTTSKPEEEKSPPTTPTSGTGSTDKDNSTGTPTRSNTEATSPSVTSSPACGITYPCSTECLKP